MRRFIVPILVFAISLISAANSTTAALPHVTLHRLWTRTLAENADSVPAYASRVTLPGGRTGAVVFALAANNTSNCDTGDPVRVATLYALNAQNGKLLWSRSTRGASRCTTAAPIVDPSGKWVYAPGLDGKAHRYDSGSGKESHAQGWPKVITLMPDVEKVSANPTIGTGHMYVTTSGFIGDQGHYQGHLVTINLRTGTAHVFNSLCSNITKLLSSNRRSSSYCADERSGLFGRGQGVVDPITHDVYVVSGNGPWNGRTNWGDSILKLDSSGSRLLDSFTPTNQQSLSNADQDLGSTGPALLPTVKVGGRAFHLLVQGGKGPACDTCHGVVLRLLNRDNLSGRTGPGHLGGDLQDVSSPGGCEVLTAPVVWKSGAAIWVFYANDCGVTGYRLSLTGAHFSIDRIWSVGQGGSTPVLAHGMLWVAHGGGLNAYGPQTGLLLVQVPIGDIHWEYPLVAGHTLYIADQSRHLTAYRIG